MIARRSAASRSLVVVGAIGLGLTGCSSTLTDAATIDVPRRKRRRTPCTSRATTS